MILENIPKLNNRTDEDLIINLGDIQIKAFLVNGHTTLSITSLHNSEFLRIMPSSANSIFVQSNKSILK